MLTMYTACIKMQFFFSKLPEVSWEHFSKHYAHVHSDLTVAAKSFGAHRVQRYTQVSKPRRARACGDPEEGS
jgi:ABC-type sulfate transport system permease component